MAFIPDACRSPLMYSPPGSDAHHGHGKLPTCHVLAFADDVPGCARRHDEMHLGCTEAQNSLHHSIALSLFHAPSSSCSAIFNLPLPTHDFASLFRQLREDLQHSVCHSIRMLSSHTNLRSDSVTSSHQANFGCLLSEAPMYSNFKVSRRKVRRFKVVTGNFLG